MRNGGRERRDGERKRRGWEQRGDERVKMKSVEEEWRDWGGRVDRDGWNGAKDEEGWIEKRRKMERGGKMERYEKKNGKK